MQFSKIEEIKPCPYLLLDGEQRENISYIFRTYDEYSDFILFEAGEPHRCFRFWK